MSNNNIFGFGQDDDHIGGRNMRFKGDGGRVYRISYAWWPGIEDKTPNLDAATPLFYGASRVYIKGVGYVSAKGPEYIRLAGDVPPRTAIATAIVVWPMGKDGIDLKKAMEGDFQVMSWVFGQDKYDAFKPIHREFPFGKHDLTITCTDTQYQKMTFSPCKDNIFRKVLEAPKAKHLADTIIAKVGEITSRLKDDVARDMTLDQIREKLMGGGNNSPAASAAGPGGQSTADIDSLVDNLLE